MQLKEDIIVDFTLYNFNQGYAFLISLEKMDEDFKKNMENYFNGDDIIISFPIVTLKKEIIEKIKEAKKDLGEIFIRASFSKISDLENYTYAFTPLSVYNISLTSIDIDEKTEKIIFSYQKNPSNI